MKFSRKMSNLPSKVIGSKKSFNWTPAVGAIGIAMYKLSLPIQNIELAISHKANNSEFYH